MVSLIDLTSDIFTFISYYILMKSTEYKVEKLIKKWRKEAQHYRDCGNWDLTFADTLECCAEQLERIVDESK